MLVPLCIFKRISLHSSSSLESDHSFTHFSSPPTSIPSISQRPLSHYAGGYGIIAFAPLTYPNLNDVLIPPFEDLEEWISDNCWKVRWDEDPEDYDWGTNRALARVASHCPSQRTLLLYETFILESCY